MRMLEYDYSKAYWVKLFSDLHDLGIRIFHSSTEYESFGFYCEVLDEFYRNYPEKKIAHIVKLAEPHFHVNEFSQTLFDEKVNEYLKKLQTDSLFCVQWMWRGDLSDNEQRKALFLDASDAISKAVSKSKSDGKIENFHCFPYDMAFADAAISQDFIDGLVVYRNILETEADEVLKRAYDLGKTNFIIRPLFAKKALESNKTPKQLVEFALDFPGVEGAVLSISSVEKIKQIL